MASEAVFYGCFATLALTIILSNFIIVAVPLQMILYTLPTLYIGSHLSLKMNEIDATTGERSYQAETVTRKDAMLFPFIGSAALFSLYAVYKLLPIYWVNLLLTAYLTAIGVAAMAQTIVILVDLVAPSSFNAIILAKQFQLPGWLKNPDGPYDIHATGSLCCSYVISVGAAVVWLYTKHWTLHNVLAIAFCIQAIQLISVGTFSIASLLLCGLFVYDIFWVFGTEVMVTVAKSFEGPAKIIFPTSFSPWKQSILGLGDIVVPGIFIAMILRFDNWTAAHKRQGKSSAATSANGNSKKIILTENVDIHERFPKIYFFCNLIAYEAALMTTVVVMMISSSPQPALLYLVPFCLLGLYGPAWYWSDMAEVLAYTEQEDEEEAATDADRDGSQKDKADDPDGGSTDEPTTPVQGDASQLRKRTTAEGVTLQPSD